MLFAISVSQYYLQNSRLFPNVKQLTTTKHYITKRKIVARNFVSAITVKRPIESENLFKGLLNISLTTVEAEQTFSAAGLFASKSFTDKQRVFWFEFSL